MTRRLWLQLAGALPAALVAFPRSPVAQSVSPDKWVDPPGAETAEIGAAIDAARRAIESGASAASALTDAQFMSVHAYSRFRQMMRDHAPTRSVTISGPAEPGDRATVRIQVTSSSGRAVPGALVYAYHTSSKGWYSDKAFHIRANSGDEKFARLFGYVRTDQTGLVEIETIRPAGYPDGNLPAHYHVEILEPTVGPITEIQFSDDPRLTAEARTRSLQEGFVISDPKWRADGSWEISATVRQRQ